MIFKYTYSYITNVKLAQYCVVSNFTNILCPDWQQLTYLYCSLVTVAFAPTKQTVGGIPSR